MCAGLDPHGENEEVNAGDRATAVWDDARGSGTGVGEVDGDMAGAEVVADVRTGCVRDTDDAVELTDAIVGRGKSELDGCCCGTQSLVCRRRVPGRGGVPGFGLSVLAGQGAAPGLITA